MSLHEEDVDVDPFLSLRDDLARRDDDDDDDRDERMDDERGAQAPLEKDLRMAWAGLKQSKQWAKSTLTEKGSVINPDLRIAGECVSSYVHARIFLCPMMQWCRLCSALKRRTHSRSSIARAGCAMSLLRRGSMQGNGRLSSAFSWIWPA